MSKTNDEIEAKFWLTDMIAFEERLRKAGARLLHPRVLEINLRFDTPDGRLTRQRRVLRLRKDYAVHLTYKGAARPGEAVSVRQEIEFEANNFEAAKAFLEALDYQVSVMYEKYRTDYKINDLVIAVDEMPYGYFCEIEGPRVSSIRSIADSLELNWEARILDSYLGLFSRLQQGGLQVHNLAFDEFKGVVAHLETLGLHPADQKTL